MEISIFTLVAIIVVFVLIYKYLRKDEHFFHDKPIPSLIPNIIFGNSMELMTKKSTILEYVCKLYNSYPEAKIFGMFDMKYPVFFLRDPEVIKKLCIKDFDHFMDHRSFFGDAAEHSDGLFANSLIALRGHKWKDMRATMSPAFTGSKMRLMYELVSEVSVHMTEYFLNESKNGRIVLEMKETFQRFANDVIASTAFGMKVDSFEDKDNKFFKMGQQIMNFTNYKTMIKFFAFRACPKLCVKLGIDLITPEQSKFFIDMVTSNMQHREAEGIVRPDMINILMQLKKGNLQHNEKEEIDLVDGFATVEESDLGKEKVHRKWTDNQIIAQAFIFFLAGFDTVSTSLQFAAYELMVNEDVQQKLYEEIIETEENLPNGRLTYEILQGMKYLDSVVCEVLRYWTPAPFTDRVCVKDYVYDDGAGCKFEIKKSNSLWIPFHAFHHDPQYFPNPEQFNPERFSDENKANINVDTYMPFGIGPRNCIGSRFALMEIKTIIYHLLLKFTFEKSEKTQIPLKLMKGAFGMKAEKGVWIEFRPRIM